jgi:hypothetical protein
MFEESKNEIKEGRRIFGVVLRGHPEDFQRWLEAAKSYDLYIIFSKSTRIGKLIIQEVAWDG